MIRHATQTTRTLAVFTPLGDDKLLLRRFEGREEISRLFAYDLELLSADDAIDPAGILGRNVTFLVQRDQSAPRYFNGFVNRFAQTGRTELAATYRPKSSRGCGS